MNRILKKNLVYKSLIALIPMGTGGIKSVLFVTHFMIGIKYYHTHVNSTIKVENRSQHALITS